MTPTKRRARMLTLKEVAEFFSLSEKTVYRMANAGTLPALKVGGQWRFEPKILDSWIVHRLNGIVSDELPGVPSSLSVPKEKKNEA